MYDIEIRLADKNGWHTPAEAKAYYGRYARDGVTWHWWDSPDRVKDSDHDSIVNYILGKAQRGVGSVNYVLSNNKITLVVGPDNVAWASQGGNPTTISVELSPHLNAEGYKKAGWLFNELEGRYGKTLKHFKHSDWFQTQCPGTIDVARIKVEAIKWKNGEYNPKPTPPPVPAPVPPSKPLNEFTLWKEGEKIYVFNKQPTYLYGLGDAKDWNGITKVKAYDKNDRVVIVGHVHNNALNRDYYITRYSFDNKFANGFHLADLDVYAPPTPPKDPPKPPAEPTKPTDPVEPTDPTPVPVPVETVPNWFIDFIKKTIEFLTGWLKK